jgi:tetratricopeptide (TPR) repeat protein
MKDELLIYVVRTVGHFLIYAHNLTLWAESRGIGVTFCGPRNTVYHQWHRDNPAVEFLDAEKLLGYNLSTTDDETIVRELFSEDRTAGQIDTLHALQKRLQPRITVLVNTDDFIFNHSFEVEDSRFATPTYGIVTFGNRNRYTGFDEIYSERLRWLIQNRGPFTRLLTLDEFQIANENPEQRYLGYLPDPYRKFSDSSGIEDISAPGAEALAHFLDKASGYVLPIVGRFDDRKNVLSLLDLARDFPDLSYAIIGSRVPSAANDPRINTIIDELSAQRRVHANFGFVDGRLFDLLFSHPNVPFAALPYEAHYGSSGIHLLALEHGKPCLVPDNGLMARRTLNAKLGLVFKHGDQDDFKHSLEKMFTCQDDFAPTIARFMNSFTKESLFDAFDYAFGVRDKPFPLPDWVDTAEPLLPKDAYFTPYQHALEAGCSGDYGKALVFIEQGLKLAKGHPPMLFRKMLFLLFSGCVDEAAAMVSGLRANPEVRHFVISTARFLRSKIDSFPYVDPSLVFRRILFPLAQTVEEFQELGGACASLKTYEMGQQAFCRALKLDPTRDDIRLNLSDILRYRGDYVASLQVLEDLERLSPKAIGIHYKRGQIYFEQGMPKEARKELNEALQEASEEHSAPIQRYLMKLSEKSEAP